MKKPPLPAKLAGVCERRECSVIAVATTAQGGDLGQLVTKVLHIQGVGLLVLVLGALRHPASCFQGRSLVVGVVVQHFTEDRIAVLGVLGRIQDVLVPHLIHQLSGCEWGIGVHLTQGQKFTILLLSDDGHALVKALATDGGRFLESSHDVGEVDCSNGCNRLVKPDLGTLLSDSAHV